MAGSTLKSRLHFSIMEVGEMAYWHIEYAPTTIDFGPVVIIDLPCLGGGTGMRPDHASMAANAIAAVDCESEAYHDLHPVLADSLPRRSRRDIFEEVIEILFAEFFVQDPDGKKEALSAFVA